MSAPPLPAVGRWKAALASLLRAASDAAFEPACAAGEHDLGQLSGPACESCQQRLRAEGAGRRCEQCSASLADETGPSAHRTCGACIARPRRMRVLAARGHRGAARALVLAMKARRREDVAPILALHAFADERTRAALVSADVVVPVPAHPVRRRERGFDPAERLAEELARCARACRPAPLRVRQALRRSSREGKQASRSAHERRLALRGDLRVRLLARHAVRGRRVVLVDDVVTTGATAAEAARLLLRSGAREVILVACTRADGILLDAPALLRSPR